MPKGAHQHRRLLQAAAVLVLSVGIPDVAHAVIRDAQIPATDPKMIKWITAARDGDLATVKAQLEAGMDINARDQNGDPALSWAAYNGRQEVVEHLLQKGADASLKNTSGRWGANYMPLQYAAAGGHLKLVQRFYERLDPKQQADASFEGARNFGLRVAASNRQLSVAAFFLQQGADVNLKSASGRTALMEATVSLDEAVITFLLDRGADVKAKDREGVTALHEAARRGWRVAMSQRMVERGADVNAKTTAGETPVYWATQTASSAAVEYLLDQGADAGAADARGKTPLMLAAQAGKTDIVKLLLEHAASATAKAANGDTALKLAGDKQEIAALLRQKGATE
jgi:ankyrin repeat protein